MLLFPVTLLTRVAPSGGGGSSWIDPALFGMPHAGNTGVRSGVTLTAYSGSDTISTAGTTIVGKTFNSVIRVTAANVTFRDCLFDNWWVFGIDADNVGATGLLVEYCTFVGGTVETNAAILGSGTFQYNDISNSENGIVLTGGASTVTNNYIHDLSDPSAEPHYDGIALQAGQDGVLIQHNTVQSWDTSCIFIKNDGGAINNITVRDNLLINQSATLQTAVPIYVVGPSVTNVLIENNYIMRGAFGYYSVVSATPTIQNNIEWQQGVDPTPYPSLSDSTPNAFSFTDATGVALSTVSTSNSITVSGIDVPSTISITGGQYEKNASGTWTSSAGTVVNGDTVKVRGTSSSSNSTAVNVILTIGGVSDTYTITTVAGAGDTTPNAFSFTDATNVALSTVSTSNSITVSGIDTPSAISVTGGEYEKNASGTWTSSSGTVVNGDTVKVRGTSSSSNSTAVNVVLNIGGVTDTYTITTVAAAGAFSFTPFAYYDETSIVNSGSGTASTWTDKGPNGINLVQATSAAQPTITSSRLVFDGTDDVMISAAPLNLNAKTAICAFALLKINGFGTAGDGDGILVLGVVGSADTHINGALLFYPYDPNTMGTFRGSAAFNIPAAGGTDLLLGVTYDIPGDSVTLYNKTANNSVTSSALTNDSLGASVNVVLGCRWIGGAPAPGYYAPFEIKRLLLLDFVPNSTQLTEIWTVLGA